MLDWLLVPVGAAYFAVTLALFAYGVNFLVLTVRTLRVGRAGTPPVPPGEWPRVTVQLPIYNELYVAERLIDAVAQLDYPVDRLDIQVLDDSTDETAEIARGAVARWRARGVSITHLRRLARTGYKAGALAAGLAQARGEFIAIFDADFVPQPGFLRRVMPHFADPRTAFVQARWGHLNRDASLLTRLQALAIDGHFMVEQFARSRAGAWFNFNGTAGVWRRAAIEDAGGWTADTLTEDLDLSYRAFLRGWRAQYVRDVVVPAELPAGMSAYRRQQQRWARGSLECALKLMPRVWRSSAPLAQRAEATLHLTGYAVHLCLLALAVLYPPVVALAGRHAGLVALFGMAALFNLTAFAPTLLFAVAQQQRGPGWPRSLPAVLFLSVFGAGMMLNTARAALAIVLRRSGRFERTPKFGLAWRAQNWRTRRYQLRLDPIVFAELAFGLFNAATVWAAARGGQWGIAFYAGVFALGLIFAAGMTLVQHLSEWRKRARVVQVDARYRLVGAPSED